MKMLVGVVTQNFEAFQIRFVLCYENGGHFTAKESEKLSHKVPHSVRKYLGLTRASRGERAVGRRIMFVSREMEKVKCIREPFAV